ncbi:MAG TPA: hypothetical protein VM008_03615 [Phycisphaerae bacterium]|nr:hypothetical protein [Phycisphaerae bacterium]
MGDFDKQKTSDPSAEKKKLAVVGALGAILIGVLVVHSVKSGPQSASASVFSSASDTPGDATMDETPAQAEAALANDPTAKLLRGSSKPEQPSGERTPHNPFLISPEWRNMLVRAPEVHEPIYTPQPTVYTPAPQAVNLQNYKLSGILQQRDKTLCAIINGRIVSTGMTVDDARVVDIAPDHVTLQHADSPTGPKSDLTIEPKLK